MSLKKVVLIIAASLLLSYPKTADAHLAGQPPYFMINGVYSPLYFVPLTSLSDFDLPQDMAPGSYFVNQPIQMGMDINRLPAPPDVVRKTKFTWTFGDGSVGEGLSNTHTYTKMGSYILKIDADDGTTPTPQLLESVLINVLPDKSYQLPRAIIKVNGRQSKDPLTDVLDFSLKDPIYLDATSSQGDIASYFWDLGDQQSSTKPTNNHTYEPDLTQIFPVLRVKDKNGFIADNFVEIENQDQALGTANLASRLKPPVASKQPQSNKLPLILGLGALGVIGVFMARRFARGRGRGRYR